MPQEDLRIKMTVEAIENSIYARLANSPSFYLVCLDTKGCYTYANEVFFQRLAFLTPDLIGRHYELAILPDDLPHGQHMLETSLARPGEVFTLRLRIYNDNGGFDWTHWEITSQQNAEGKVEGIICVGHYLPPGETIYREAIPYTKKLDNIIEHITDGFLIIDKNWRFVKVNRVFEEIVGVNRDQVLGQLIWDVFPDNVKYQYPAAYRRALRDNITTSFLDYNEEAKRWFEGTVYPSEEGLTVIFSDITEKKLAEEKIRESTSKLSAILDSTTDINILLDRNYRVLSFNKMAYESMKVYYDDRRLAQGQNVLEYILPGTEEDFIRNFQSALRGKAVEVRIKLFFKPGLALWFLVKYFPVYDTEGNIIGVSFNSTNIDQQQRQLEKLEEIASLYSHEIRRPVATILGITQLIDQEELSHENQEWINYLRKTTLELDRVIHRIVRKTTEIR